jgi:hypothetical protein
MPRTELTSGQSAALDNAKQLFSNWREARIGRERIPDRLWNSAADLFHTWEMSIHKIARSLRLNHSALKAKIQTVPLVSEKPSDDIQPSPTFIEVEPAGMASDCVIEMENPSGVKVRMCFRGRADPAVVSLGRYFLGGHP